MVTIQEIKEAIEKLNLPEGFNGELTLVPSSALYDDNKAYKINGRLLITNTVYEAAKVNLEEVLKRPIEVIDMDLYFAAAKKESGKNDIEPEIYSPFIW